MITGAITKVFREYRAMAKQDEWSTFAYVYGSLTFGKHLHC